MTNLAINEFTTSKWTFEEDIRFYSQAGFEGIGIAREKIVGYSPGEVSRLVKGHHLAITEVCSIGHLVCKDLDSQKHYLKDAIDAIHVASAIESGPLIVLAGSEPSFDQAQSLAAFFSSIDQLLPIAEHHNIRLALEPLHPMYKASLSFLVTLSDALDFVNHYQSDYLGIWLDMHHIWWDPKVYENIIKAKGRIFGVHINDWLPNPMSLYDWGMPGQGVIPLEEILSVVASTGWQGMYSIEVISEDTAPAKYPNVLEYCRRWYNSIS